MQGYAVGYLEFVSLSLSVHCMMFWGCDDEHGLFLTNIPSRVNFWWIFKEILSKSV